MSRFISCRLIAPDSVQGEVFLPSSKSISNRALMLNALSGNTASIEALADCEDSELMQRALQSKDALKDAGAAGTVMRFLTAYYAITPGKWTLTGTERMKQRPIGILVEALRSLGANISYIEKDGFPPLQIRTKQLKGRKLNVDGSISSQYISALMMIGPYVQGGLEIELVNKIASEPYIRMTASMMEAFGAELSFKDQQIRIAEGKYTAPPSYRIEADWSAASYWFEILSLAKSGKLILQGLQAKSIQGDAKVMEWFEAFGVKAEFIEPPFRTKSDNKALLLTKTANKTSFFEADFSQQPDLAQTFVLTAVLNNIPFRISGLESLKIKETNRLQALIREMLKLGFVLEESSPNLLEWQGKRIPAQADISIESYQDHRMAMAFAPAALWAKQQDSIEYFDITNPAVVGKSYPGFWKDLQSCGFTLKFN